MTWWWDITLTVGIKTKKENITGTKRKKKVVYVII